jgi:hypothetical protein
LRVCRRESELATPQFRRRRKGPDILGEFSPFFLSACGCDTRRAASLQRRIRELEAGPSPEMKMPKYVVSSVLIRAKFDTAISFLLDISSRTKAGGVRFSTHQKSAERVKTICGVAGFPRESPGRGRAMTLFAFRLLWLGTIVVGAGAGFCIGWTCRGSKIHTKETLARENPSTVQPLFWRDEVVN